MCVHLLSPIVNPYLHSNPNLMCRSPHQCRIAFVFGECYFLLFYVTFKLPELGFAVKYLFYFVVFINGELFPLLLAGILHSLPHQSWLWRTRTQHLSSQPCVWYHVLKEKKMPLGIYSLLLSFFDRWKSEKMLSMLLNLVLFYSFPEMMTFRFPDQPFPAMEIIAADQVICVLISDDAQHIFIVNIVN